MRTSTARHTMILLSLGLAGCATAGTAITSAQVEFIKDGVTRQEEVSRQLGTPHVTQPLPNGQTLSIYDFTKADSQSGRCSEPRGSNTRRWLCSSATRASLRLICSRPLKHP